MEERACWICGAGDFTPRLLAPAAGDVVVAADGGLAYLDGAASSRIRFLGILIPWDGSPRAQT